VALQRKERDQERYKEQRDQKLAVQSGLDQGLPRLKPDAAKKLLKKRQAVAQRQRLLPVKVRKKKQLKMYKVQKRLRELVAQQVHGSKVAVTRLPPEVAVREITAQPRSASEEIPAGFQEEK